MLELLSLIEKDVPVAEIGHFLDTLDLDSRLRQIAGLKRDLQAKLFGKALANVTLEDLVPAKTPPLKEIIFYGYNSLACFNHFQKRFCRLENGNTLGGYNHQPLSCVTGPGYFVVADNSDRRGEVMIDYTRIPDHKPDNWPALKNNRHGITKIIYGSMKDYLRRVSETVLIGEATKKGQSLNQYFILCR